MTVKFLTITDDTQIQQISQMSDLLDVEVINIDNLNIDLNEIQQINLPFNLKYFIVDLELNRREGDITHEQFNNYNDALEYIIQISNKFKIPFGCKFAFRYGVEVYEPFPRDNIEPYRELEFIILDGKVLYNTDLNSSYRGKYSESYKILKTLVDTGKRKYNDDEIFKVSAEFFNRLVNLINK
jgi:hypothetical protein